MLRKIRIAFAVVCFVLVTLLFLDFTGTLHAWFGWLAKIQFLPALLALNFGVVAVLVILTLLFGRIYCSVICPLGVMQDGISSVAGRVKRNRFRYSEPLSWLRYGMLALFIVSLVAGGGLVIGGLARLIAPYSAFGRIAQNLFAPIWQAGNNLAAWVAERVGSYAFYETDVWIKSAATFGVALATFAVIAVLAWRNGRTWCNTVCPVGTVLGFLSRYSLFRPVIDTEKCIDCGLCARRCKASCIDAKNHEIDYSRCVACFDCLENCSKHAISYTARRKSAKHDESVKHAEPAAAESNVVESADGKGISRRKFLSLAAVFAATAAVKAQEKKWTADLP